MSGADVFRVLLALGALASCRADVQPSGGANDARTADIVDASPPPPHASPTPAAIAYFADISDSLRDDALITALHDKLRNDHVSISFAALFGAYETLDRDRDGCDGIFDFYSSQCWATVQACGNYSQEGDCFNREHSWPKSWWGGASGPQQYEDLVAVIPADGYVNNKRGDLSLGTVVSGIYTSSNGSRRGLCNAVGSPPGTSCFEPPNALKGDFARIYFYMATRYQGEFTCCDEPAVNGADIKPWQETMLRGWSALDPVDTWERERNERVFGIQKNRNPFVDFPSFIERIADF